ncbi:MAG: conjugal transfer protein TrbE [Pseudomonadota bacterium]
MPISTNDCEKTATEHIPYGRQYDEHTCGTVDGDLTQTIHIAGIPFETLSDEEINGFSRQWFSAINTLGAKNTRAALWTHMVRRKINYDMSRIEYDNWFSAELGRQYGARIGAKDFYAIDLYLSPVYRPAPGKTEKLADALADTTAQRKRLIEAGVDELEKIAQQLLVSLRRYHPTRLGSSVDRNGQITSELAHFYSTLLNGGESGPVALNSASVRYAIQRNDLHFGAEIVEIQMPTSSRYVGILGLKAPYGRGDMEIGADLLHDLLRIRCEYVLSQSITFLPMNEADKFLRTQLSQIASAEQNSIMEKQLKEAIEQLQAGKYGIAEHEFILAVYGDSIKDVNAGVAEAVAALEAKALAVTRERRGTLISQYFSMLPANFSMGRLRAMPISTDNFSSFFPMHNFLTGNVQGSQWGMPLLMLETTSGAPYFFNYHVGRKFLKEQEGKLEYEDPRAEDDDNDEVRGEKVQRKESGNILYIGGNGVGKTVVQTLIRGLTHKRIMKGSRPYKSYAFDADCGQEIFINASGGRYFRFKTGEPTGIAPFSLPNTEENRQFIIGLVKWCASQDQAYVSSSDDDARLKMAVEEVYKLDSGRKFARLRDLLPKGRDTLHSALGRWVESGNEAWILDNDEDRLDLDGANDFGFDMTTFLALPYARTPILMCIMHKINLSAAGSPHSIDIDEASTALRDSFLQEMIEMKARRIRKQDGIIGLGLQNASDACSGALASTLMNQFPLKIAFPNPTADRKEYVDGCKFTDSEFLLIREGMLDKPGKFLLKKGNESVVICADLTGMNDMLAVLSGSTDNTVIAREIMARLGNDPKVWLPEFFQRRT